MRLLTLLARYQWLVLAALFAGSAAAHTGLKESVPADQAVVNTAPAAIQLVFTAAVSLVRVELLHAGEHAMDIGFKPVATPTTEFSIPLPPLAPAAYTVNWSVIGADGHTVSNSFAFTVDPTAMAHAHGADHAHGTEHQHDPAHHAEVHGDQAGQADHTNH